MTVGEATGREHERTLGADDVVSCSGYWLHGSVHLELELCMENIHFWIYVVMG